MKFLTNLEKVAIAKVVKDEAAKDASSQIPSGDYSIDFVVRVTGSLKKGEDYDQPIVAKCDPWLLFAVALSKLNGVTVDSIVRESTTMDDAMLDGLKEKAAEAIQTIKGALPPTRCNGKITTKLEVIPVS